VGGVKRAISAGNGEKLVKFSGVTCLARGKQDFGTPPLVSDRWWGLKKAF